MQIRQRKHAATLIRTQYDPTIKRGRSVSLGSVPYDSESIPPEIDARLRPAERTQLEAFLAHQRVQLELQLQEQAARELAQQIQRAGCWYERQRKSPELAAQAKAIRDAFTSLLAAMVRAGVGRTRRRARKST